MSKTDFDWQSLLHTDAPAGSLLKAALFTTYDRADPTFLAEHLLPCLLKLNREPDGEGTERQYFLTELGRRLNQLHGKLVVVSSTLREEPVASEENESEAYNWIWSSIRSLTVGSQGKAVQHAKLWLLHWGASDDTENQCEYLEVVVSSANLTRSAFTNQIQAAWRTCIELNKKSTKTRLTNWGVLPDFLRKLAESAGDIKNIEPFIDLLSRADCPEKTTFVASVPGSFSRQDLRRIRWGAAGLRSIMPTGRGAVSTSVLSPFVGSWTSESLSRWCNAFGGQPDRLNLLWIDKSHPWSDKWQLPQNTLATLTQSGAHLLHLRYLPYENKGTDRFHDEHHSEDSRWSHAKVYALRRGNSRRILVTSANFSTSAWGYESKDGKLTIENFELGVCVEQTIWPFEGLQAFENEDGIATISQSPDPHSALITWCQANWDGQKVLIECRCESVKDLEGKINRGEEEIPIQEWKISDDIIYSAQVPWIDTKRPPLSVQLKCLHETINIIVFDDRPSQERADLLPPEIDKNDIQALYDDILLEEYGGNFVNADENSLSSNYTSLVNESLTEYPEEESEAAADAGFSDSYAVPAFDLARRYLSIVDNWVSQVEHALNSATSEFELQLLKRDGELLIGALHRQSSRDSQQGKDSDLDIGARLAAEELTLRLKHFLET